MRVSSLLCELLIYTIFPHFVLVTKFHTLALKMNGLLICHFELSQDDDDDD